MKEIGRKISKFFRLIFNSKEVTQKDYKNSDDLVKRKVEELRLKKDQRN